MNTTYEEALKLVSEIAGMVEAEVMGDAEVILAPPFTFLYSVSRLLPGNSRIQIGAQNCHQEEKGAYTGEISPLMLNSLGVKYVILGHSERRLYFKEDGQLLKSKLDAALKNQLSPIFCCGEQKEERESERHFAVVRSQVEESLFHLSEADFKKVVIAYEPVWAIGTGLTATANQAQEMHHFIRNEIAGKYGQGLADQTVILYGGSCNASNAKELFSNPDVDGGLIGGASLKSRDFVEIIKSF